MSFARLVLGKRSFLSLIKAIRPYRGIELNHGQGNTKDMMACLHTLSRSCHNAPPTLRPKQHLAEQRYQYKNLKFQRSAILRRVFLELNNPFKRVFKAFYTNPTSIWPKTPQNAQDSQPQKDCQCGNNPEQIKIEAPKNHAPPQKLLMAPPQSGWASNLPNKQELLDGLHGFFPRLKVHLRWLLKGASISRPWTIDDIFALISWVIMSHAMMLLIATTTFVSVVVWLLNSLQFQRWLSKKMSQWVSQMVGISVEFDSGISPSWRQGTICFYNVKIKCGPEHGLPIKSEGSTKFEPSDESPSTIVTNLDHPSSERDTNFTYYDISINQLQITLSLWRWLDGKGLVKDCSVKGVRGIIDRRHVWWDPNIEYNPAEERSKHRPGAFEFETFEAEDCFVTLLNIDNFRPFTISIYSASLPQLRQQWFMYDVLAANSIVGMYDQSLFSVHRTHQRGRADDNTQPKRSKTHMQIDNLNIDHINEGAEGPIGWLTSGKVSVSAVVIFPEERQGNTTETIKHLVNHLTDSVDAVILPSKPDWADPQSSNNPIIRILRGANLLDTPLSKHLRKRLMDRNEYETQKRLEQHENASSQRKHSIEASPDSLTIDLNVSLNDIRASVPLRTPHLSYLSSTVLIRPIVGYMNSHRTSLPIRCRLRLDHGDFNGAWNLYDSGISYLTYQGMGEAFVRLVKDEQERNRRLKLIGWWSLGTLAKEIVNLFEYITGERDFWHYIGISENSASGYLC